MLVDVIFLFDPRLQKVPLEELDSSNVLAVAVHVDRLDEVLLHEVDGSVVLLKYFELPRLLKKAPQNTDFPEAMFALSVLKISQIFKHYLELDESIVVEHVVVYFEPRLSRLIALREPLALDEGVEEGEELLS